MIVDFQAVYLTGRLVRFKRGRGSSLNDDEAPLTSPQSISGSFQLVFLHFSLCFCKCDLPPQPDATNTLIAAPVFQLHIFPNSDFL